MKNWIACAAIAAASLPAAGADTYTIDKDHTYPSFEFAHMGISVWRGRFNRTSGTVSLDRAARTGSVNILVNTESIDFGNAKMNEAAITDGWLNTGQYPTMTYQGTIKFEGDKPASIDGRLSLLGVSKPLTLRINQFKCIPHPIFRREVCGADVEGELNRADWGMTMFSEGEAGRLRLRISVEGLKD
jgi:polyisoprenoid-binding protein YceI